MPLAWWLVVIRRRSPSVHSWQLHQRVSAKVCGWNDLHQTLGKYGNSAWDDRAQEKAKNMMQQRFWTLVCKHFRCPLKVNKRPNKFWSFLSMLNLQHMIFQHTSENSVASIQASYKTLIKNDPPLCFAYEKGWGIYFWYSTWYIRPYMKLTNDT